MIITCPCGDKKFKVDANLIPKFSLPSRVDSSKKIVSTLRKYSSKSLGKLMNVSEKISNLNYFKLEKRT